ncbi:hypothetical protein C7434_0999 [Pantoea sp. PNA 14-12]|uniref:hypothetical protein n=1 Tax=Pantoea TaxID=53335 RepID=UPI00050D9A35|nr:MULTISPECIES: hypothetical protein [Pantoea]KKW52393.1 hypothetical protein XB02_00485 [Pantoea ananatis]KGD82531.1 hypothetical protein HA47_17305 [Pantoea stewartii subsp. indologenes]KHE02174.1 hypothetical protein NL54_05390 [Pantoea stewartii]KHN61843.1 hypothetical protein OI73_13330 [Pantoea stewartii]KTS28125.1 hypothetical protein NS381_12235 [Pantoea stewartii]
MLKSSYYYVCPYNRSGWIIHKEGCVHLYNSRGREFIGSLYSRQQALTVAKIHHPEAILCTVCLSHYVCPTAGNRLTSRGRPLPTRHTPKSS